MKMTRDYTRSTMHVNSGQNVCELVAALKKCTKRGNMEYGKILHGDAIKSDLHTNDYVSSILITMYGKCQWMIRAQEVFDSLPCPDVVTWNSLMMGYVENGEYKTALDLFVLISCEPSAISYVSALKACGGLPSQGFKKSICLQRGMQIHQTVKGSSFDQNLVVANALLHMYVKCGSMELAREVFDGMHKRDVVTWNTLCVGYTENGDGKTALTLLASMDCQPSCVSFVVAMKACTSLIDEDKKFCIDKASALEAQISELGFDSDLVVVNTMLSMYTKLGNMKRARELFDSMLTRNVASWTSIMLGYVVNGQPLVAVDLYKRMDCAASSITYVAAIKASQGVKQLDQQFCLEKIMEVHKRARKEAFDTDLSVVAALLEAYGQCSAMNHAAAVFNRSRSRDTVTWNILMLGFVCSGDSCTSWDLFTVMDCAPSPVTYVAAAKACGSMSCKVEFRLELGMKLHRRIEEEGFTDDVNVANNLITMYGNCGSMRYAREVFDRMQYRDTGSWNAVLRACIDNSECREAIDVFMTMMNCVRNSTTYILALKACGLCWQERVEEEVWLRTGMWIHTQVKQAALDAELDVVASLIEMYGKCRAMYHAQETFVRTSQRDVVVWNSLINGYVESGEFTAASEVFNSMDCQPNDVTYILMLKVIGNSCSEVEKKLEYGIKLHERIKKTVYDRSSNVANALINMYSKCKSMQQARIVFEKMTTTSKDVVSWTSLIQGYIGNGESSKAIEVFSRMKCEPSPMTYAAVLKACATLASENPSDKKVFLELGMSVHKEIKSSGCESEVTVSTSLVDMYSKCGSMEQAKTVFDKTDIVSVACLNSLIFGFVENGESVKAMEVFSSAKWSPNIVTYVGLLKACGCFSSLSCGKKIHVETCRHGIMEECTLFSNALMDFYVKCGRTSKAARLLDEMQSPDIVSWNTLIAGYSSLGDSSKVFSLVGKMQDAGYEMDNITYTSVLTACSHTGLLSEGKSMFKSMFGHGVRFNVEQFNCLVDMLGRANRLQEAFAMIKSAPFETNTVTWMTLLGASRKWNNLEAAKVAYNALTEIKSN